MNSGILPLLLICGTIGLALAFSPKREGWISLAAMAASAIAVSQLPLAASASEAIFRGVWLSVIGTAALTYIPRNVAHRLLIPAGVNAGCWAGALAGVSDKRAGLLLALLMGLTFIPAKWFTSRGYHVVIKVAASWMIAIASLSVLVSYMATPGYKPDHME